MAGWQRAAAWWQRAVVYEVYPRSFADSNGDGIGDLQGVINHLDHLTDLGVDVLWLAPMYPSPWIDGGYDIADYCGIDPRFGTLADFDQLLAACHRRGLRVIIDLVPNHTSDEHPWFVESRSSRESPKRDWYWWRPPRPGRAPGEPGAEPTNWRSEFHEPAWQFDPATGEYYLHLYSKKQPDLNWENPQLRRAIYDVMRWWLDRGVNGFRIDVVNKISKDPTLPDVAVEPGERYGNARQHYVNGPRVHEFVQEMHREVFAGHRDRIMTVGEASGTTVEDGRRYTDPARHELDMIFTFEHVRLDQRLHKFDVEPLDLVALKSIMARWQDGLADVGWNSLYWENHDQPRVVSRWGDDGDYRVQSAMLFATLLHLHRGTPFVYQGEEIGMTNIPICGSDGVLDIEARNLYARAVAAGDDPAMVLRGLRTMARDNARSPMQWDASAGAGFTTGTPWQPLNPNYRQINVAAQHDDSRSVLAYYRQLIKLRHTEPILTDGVFHLLLPDDPQVYAFTRTLGDDCVLVLGNVGGHPVDVDLADRADWADAPLLIANYPDLPARERFRLRPWEVCAYRRSLSARG
jgi:oligo-1,6-glucosidase